MQLETEAYIDEYVIEGENTGTFAGDETSITYTPEYPDRWPSFSIPTENISVITFKRNTSLHNNRLLGGFFAAFSILLVLLVYIETFAGQGMNPDVDFITIFLGFLIIGSTATAHEYFTGESPDIIVITIRTDEGEHQIICGALENAEFVDACRELIESHIETKTQNTTLERKLNTDT